MSHSHSHPLKESDPNYCDISVIILNYNGACWLQRCLDSLRAQTVFGRIEVLVADNASPDGSATFAAELMRNWPAAEVLALGENLGFAEGNNRAARRARGRWLFFLNNDAWLEPDCLELLLAETKAAEAQAAGPLVLNYTDSSFQSLGAAGFDLCGLASTRRIHDDRRLVFMPEGCAFLVQREWFLKVGGFDPEFFMFSEEFDLSWRLWLSGCTLVAVPAARVHHRGAAQVNPAGGETVLEFRSSDQKRYYANRNGLMTVLKNAGMLCVFMVPLQALLLSAEALISLIIVRRWSFVRQSYLRAVADCWRLRKHISNERRRLRYLRRKGDWWMLRFLKIRFNRWDELLRMRRMGLPKVSAS